MIGRTISHYRVIELLGAGGMGEVYRAEDTRLERMVAMKFLPRSDGGRTEERERLVREARSASALNHPNICTIHEVDEAEGEVFIVMELLEGRSVRAMIASGPLPVADMLRVAANVVSGLQAAHAKGIVHGDIKPENIMVTP